MGFIELRGRLPFLLQIFTLSRPGAAFSCRFAEGSGRPGAGPQPRGSMPGGPTWPACARCSPGGAGAVAIVPLDALLLPAH